MMLGKMAFCMFRRCPVGKGLGRDFEARVAVPVEGSRAFAAIAGGSGVILAPEDGTGRVRAWFEGNLYGACNLAEWTERVGHARSRAAEGYPTAAFGLFDESDFKVVGTVGPGFPSVPDVFDRDAVGVWCKTDAKTVEGWLASAEQARSQRVDAEAFRKDPVGFSMGRLRGRM